MLRVTVGVINVSDVPDVVVPDVPVWIVTVDVLDGNEEDEDGDEDDGDGDEDEDEDEDEEYEEDDDEDGDEEDDDEDEEDEDDEEGVIECAARMSAISCAVAGCRRAARIAADCVAVRGVLAASGRD